MAEDGFLQRWSKRKASLGDRAPDAPPKSGVGQLPVAPPVDGGVLKPPNPAPTARADAPDKAQPGDAHTAAPPAPSLADTQALTPASDFRPFMGQGVAPEVKNAAMKKLFADPHFNVMDRMDIYIDDYSQPDPLPLAMLRQMNGAKFLNLFEDEDKDKDKDKAALACAPAEGAIPTSLSPVSDRVAVPETEHTPTIEAPSSAQAPVVPDEAEASGASAQRRGDTTLSAITLPAPKA